MISLPDGEREKAFAWSCGWVGGVGGEASDGHGESLCLAAAHKGNLTGGKHFHNLTILAGVGEYCSNA